MATQWSSLAGVAQTVGKPLWVTCSWGYGTAWADAWLFAQHAHITLSYGHARAFLYCRLGASGASGLEALAVDQTPTKRWYVLKHYSRWIRPGATRLSVSAPASVLATAYHQTADSTVAVVLLNIGAATSVMFSVTTPDPPIVYSVWRTSQTEDCVSLGSLAAADSLLLPAQSITTLYGRDYHPGTPNTPPRFTNWPDSLVVQQGSSAPWTARAEDDESDPVTFSFSTTASYVQQANDSTISAAPQPGDAGAVVRVIASDGRGGLDTFDLRVIVEPAVGVPQRKFSATGRTRLSGSMALYDFQGRVLYSGDSGNTPRLSRGQSPAGCSVLVVPGKRPELVSPSAGMAAQP